MSPSNPSEARELTLCQLAILLADNRLILSVHQEPGTQVFTALLETEASSMSPYRVPGSFWVAGDRGPVRALTAVVAKFQVWLQGKSDLAPSASSSNVPSTP